MDAPPIPEALPSELRFLQTYLARSRELSRANPIIAYFCKLYMVQQILTGGFHQRSAECAAYAGALLDNIEYLKTHEPALLESEGQEILNDDLSAFVYTEGFAQSVFDKADRDVQSHQCTKQTAAALFAAATFYSLTSLFPVENSEFSTEEINARIKYAKYHAARILKALKEGSDPNDYELPQKDTEGGVSDGENDGNSEKNGTDDGVTKEQVNAVLDEAIRGSFRPGMTAADIESEEDAMVSKLTLGGPDGSDGSATDAPATLPSFPAPPTSVGDSAEPHDDNSLAPVRSPSPSPSRLPSPPPVVSTRPTELHITKENVQRIVDESELYATVQKHAKFAISALNYEDVETAKRELSTALALLEKNA